MATPFFMKINDYTPEASSVQAQGLDLTAVNFDAEVTKAAALVQAIVDISIGKAIRWHLQHKTQIVSNEDEPATSEYAQREAKWLVRYHANVGGAKYRAEIPAPNLTLLDAGNKGFLDITTPASPGADFKAAWEAYVVDDFGNGVTVDSVQHVGRNN